MISQVHRHQHVPFSWGFLTISLDDFEEVEE